MTPTEDLIMEVLAARYRLGENLWPFDSKLRPQLVRLESRGFIHLMSGNVPNTVRASLTEVGKKEQLLPNYISPLEKSLVASAKKKMHAFVEELLDE